MTPWITQPIPFNIGQGAAAGGTPAAAIGGWLELDRDILTGTGSAMSCINFSAYDNLMIICYPIFGDTNSKDVKWGMGGTSIDSGSNYSYRFDHNGNGDWTAVNQTPSNNTIINSGNDVSAGFGIFYIVNNPITSEKSLISNNAVTPTASGASDVSGRATLCDKWSNTSDAVQSVEAFRPSYDLLTDSEMIVLGYDSTNETPFWEELTSVDFSATADTYDTGAFTAKKYLYFNGWVEGSGATELTMRVNGDSGTSYACQRENDGTDASFASQTFLKCNASGASDVSITYMNGFWSNIDGAEKLMNYSQNSSEGSGAGNSPRRSQGAGKFTGTSQITSIQFFNNSTGDFTSGHITVFGAD